MRAKRFAFGASEKPANEIQQALSTSLGEGSVHASYTTALYPSIQNGADLSGTVGAINLINDFPVYQNTFSQLS